MDEMRQIRAVYNENTIRVYQAYSREIAEEAVRLGRFGQHFKPDRMTWIKPSFLWMMYRCGWAQKEGQEHVLAIDITREGFDTLVREAVLSSYSDKMGITREEWKRLLKASEVRCQWDQEKDIHGNSLAYRSIQLGLRGHAVRRYIDEWTVRIEDITQQVHALRQGMLEGEDVIPLLPQEKKYPLE